MTEFNALMEVSDKLMSPEGCQWDIKQTFESLRPYILEEAHELLDALESAIDKDIIEELADLLYVVIFYAQVAKKEGRFTLDDVLAAEREKLVRRHPHVFADVKYKDMDEFVKAWEANKQEEKKERKSALDGIPKNLPMLARAQKLLPKLIKKHLVEPLPATNMEEEELGERLFHLVELAHSSGLDAESALRAAVLKKEALFRIQEKEALS